MYVLYTVPMPDINMFPTWRSSPDLGRRGQVRCCVRVCASDSRHDAACPLRPLGLCARAWPSVGVVQMRQWLGLPLGMAGTLVWCRCLLCC